jgi:hypothetical protein
MARDIEEFLRRAAERRQQQKGGQPQPRQPAPARQPIEIVESEIVQRTPPKRKPATKQPRQTLQQQRQTRLDNEQRERDLRDESVEQHVGRHLNTNDITEQASRLGQGIIDVHDRVDSAIHQRLDHDIGKIDDRPTITDDPRPGVVGEEAAPLAVQLLRMLATPQATQQAILIAEVLNRPDFDRLDDED